MKYLRREEELSLVKWKKKMIVDDERCKFPEYCHNVTPLQMLAASEHFDLFNKVISKRQDLTHQNIRGEGLLHYAAMRCRYRNVHALLKAGVNPNSKSSTGGTALHSARGESCRITRGILIYFGADLDAKNGFGNKSLELSKEKREELDFFYKLIRK